MSVEVDGSRRAREAIGNSAGTERRVAEALACLDRQVSLDELTRSAAERTREHFAVAAARKWRVLPYAPLYLSNYCVNHCLYCGFRAPEKIARRHLSLDEALGQAEILRGRGFRHLLLVAGESPRLTTTDYFEEVVRRLVDRGIEPAVEIAPQSTESYARLAAAGVCGVTLYQETYDRTLYARYHPAGRKASYAWRREGLGRAAEAGLGRLGLGILLGLADPHQDLAAMIRHGSELRRAYPDRTLAFSLPRIHQAPQDFTPPWPVDDETFVRMYCALRVAFPGAELVLSTRESPSLRDRLAATCITQMSAGSCTAPGGYDPEAVSGDGEQFPVDDRRTPADIAAGLAAAGFAVAWDV